MHGTGQVIHFDTSAVRDMRGWIMGVNSNLPTGIAVRWAKPVSDEFHARFSATARRYRYVIYNHKYRPAILRSGLSHYHQQLDISLMQQAAPALLGEQDFSAFRAIQCQSKTPFRNVHHLRIERFGDYIVLDIKAKAFLHHMVRNIMGCLLEIGQGCYEIDHIDTMFAAEDRTAAGITAPPDGLYFIQQTILKD